MGPEDFGPDNGASPGRIRDERIWVDGCWDFFHHGHAGAMLQARQLGDELYVGIHSDEEILENKGPTVMTLEERISAVEACRWVSKSIPYAPYVTDLKWISFYGCKYVVHGDDITSDSSGNDCYRFVKEAGRFKVVKRTPSISTTDLVGRMLLCTRTHFIKSLTNVLSGLEGSGTEEERMTEGKAMRERIRLYATDETGLNSGASVWFWHGSLEAREEHTAEEKGRFSSLELGTPPQPGQRIIYVDGGFDLFSSGHIEFLRQVVKKEEEIGRQNGWYTEEAIRKRKETGLKKDYGPCYVVAGVHDDEVINHWKGVNYPIMNIYERGLCVLQCKYINALIFSAPFTPTIPYLSTLPFSSPKTPNIHLPAAVYHGPTSFMPLTYDPYSSLKTPIGDTASIYQEIGNHAFQDVNAGTIVERIMKSRSLYEERQRVKAQKAIAEEEEKRREAEELKGHHVTLSMS